jgi:hypothetical protein
MITKIKNKGLKATVVSLFLLTSCVGDAQFRQYVLADRKFFDVQKEHYEVLLNASSTSTEDMATHIGRVTAKEKQLTAAEEALGIKR